MVKDNAASKKIKPHKRSDYIETLDQTLQSIIGKLTGGLSPAALLLAFFDWFLHLNIHPAKQLRLLQLYQENFWYLFRCYFFLMDIDKNQIQLLKTTPQDKRFANHLWHQFPYNFIHENFLLVQNWWHAAATNVRGMSCHHEEVVDFTFRQFLDMLSPSNFPYLNPEIQRETIAQVGFNFIKGLENFIDDLSRYYNNMPPAGAENFIIGQNIAVTQGKVIYRNRLIELIQYLPEREQVYAEPILITPAWIMKYYILDLTPKHSLVKYLVKKGHTVFMISWKNPNKDDRDLGMMDYLNLGIMSALDVISDVLPQQKIHLVGYCLGGTLAAIAASMMARDNDKRLISLTLFAAQVDFKEPGELGLFIDESQIAYLENLMYNKGFLDTHQLAGAFQLLRSNDLIWSRMIREYMLGERKPLTDLMAWNADATRLPYRMHSEYLRQLFLHNQLAEGKYFVKNRAVSLGDITIPIFVVATERDHVSPWRSVFKINLLASGNLTFALTSGGHNVGIVSLPVKNTKRYYRLSTLKDSDHYIDAETWYQTTKPHEGSWWPAWEHWLTEISSEKHKPPPIGAKTVDRFVLEDAPGTYVFQK